MKIYKKRIAVRLWLMIMMFVLISIVFMWTVQIFLFEQNYIDASVDDFKNQLKPVVEEIKTSDLKDNDELVSKLSKMSNSKMLIVDQSNEIIVIFSAGHPIQYENSIEYSKMIKNYVANNRAYQKLWQGISYDQIVRYGEDPFAIEIGLPVVYDKKPAALILYQTLDHINTVADINRKQLINLTVILTIVASIMAAIWGKHFLKPIREIKKAIDALANGDLTASPKLKLQDELGELSGSVDDLSSALQRVDVLRKEVIANVSHELKSPLVIIRGYAEMVRDVSGEHENVRNEHLNLIIDEATRMSKMVSDIMDYSQLQAGYIHLNMEMQNLLELIEYEVQLAQNSAKAFHIKISIVDESSYFDKRISYDALKMGQVMHNLLNNAINHTEDGLDISVMIKPNAEFIRVSVINPGEPIPTEETNLIWERYQRSQHSGGRKQGTGLGLSIVSTYLKAHKMAFGVSSAEGYNEFWFEYKRPEK